MKRALVFLVAALALMVVPLGAAETSYTDPAGDAGIGPDITTVVVSNSDTGLITLKVSVPLGPNSALFAFMDTDLNPATGVHGVERVVLVLADPSGSLLTGVMDMVSGGLEFGTGIAATSADGVVTLSFQKELLGVNDAFAFWLGSSGESDESFADGAPDSPFWTYVLTKPAPPPPVKPLIGKPVTTAAPVAGKRFTVSFPVTRSDDASPLTTAAVACKATVAGKTVPHTHTFKSGTVRAVVSIPKAAKGKQLKIAVKVTADTASTRVFTFKVR